MTRATSSRAKRANAIFALSLAACTSWRVQPEPMPEALPQGGKPRTLRVLLRSGQRVEMFDAALSGDSIIGYSRPERQPSAQRLAVATTDVALLEFQHSNPFLTALAVVGIAVGTLIVVGGFCAGLSAGASA